MSSVSDIKLIRTDTFFFFFCKSQSLLYKFIIANLQRDWELNNRYSDWNHQGIIGNYNYRQKLRYVERETLLVPGSLMGSTSIRL